MHIELGEGVDPGVTSPQRAVEAKVTWGDKGREGVEKLKFWGDVIYGLSFMKYRFTGGWWVFLTLANCYKVGSAFF